MIDILIGLENSLFMIGCVLFANTI